MTNWPVKKLGELAAPGRSIISGPFGSSIGKRFFVDAGVPVIRGNNLTKGKRKFIDDGYVFVSSDKATELKAYAVPDDIIYTAAGTIGQVGIIPHNARYDSYVISNKQIRIRLDETVILPEYAYAVLSSDRMIRKVERQNTGSTIPLINLGIIKNLAIELPTVKEQKRIIKILNDWDNYTGQMEQKIAYTEQLREGLMSQLLTGRQRVPGYNQSWAHMRVDEVFDFLPTYSHSREQMHRISSDNNSIYCLHYGDIHTKLDSYVAVGPESLPQLKEKIAIPKTRLLDVGDVIIADASEDYDGVGAGVEILDTQSMKCIAGLHTFALRPKPGLIAKGYGVLLFKNAETRLELKKVATYSKVFGISKGSFSRVKLHLPTIDEQEMMVKSIRAISDEISVIQRKKKAIQLQRQYLLENLVTGKIRVPENLSMEEGR